jgi:hypothetical protein
MLHAAKEHLMDRTGFRTTGYGNWTLTAASLIGLALAAFQYFDTGNGIAYSPGSLLVTIAAALILAASLVVLVVRNLPGWFSGLLYALIIVGLIGAALAAYFLDSYWLTALMIVGLLGCLGQLILSPGSRKIAPRVLGAERTA